MRKQSAEIIESVVYNADPEELLYLLRKVSKEYSSRIDEALNTPYEGVGYETGWYDPAIDAYTVNPKKEEAAYRSLPRNGSNLEEALFRIGGSTGIGAALGGAIGGISTLPFQNNSIFNRQKAAKNVALGTGVGSALGAVAGYLYGDKSYKKYKEEPDIKGYLKSITPEGTDDYLGSAVDGGIRSVGYRAGRLTLEDIAVMAKADPKFRVALQDLHKKMGS